MWELRFKAWDGHEMHFVRGIHFGAGVVDLEEYSVNISDVKLLHYLNYQDINGDDIYEGDVLARGRTWVVIGSIKRFFWMLFDDQMKLDFLKYEIIGNLYEHSSIVVGTDSVRCIRDKPLCPVSCVDPDLIRCVGDHDVDDITATRSLQQRELARIDKCTHKDKYLCKWRTEKQERLV